MQEDKVILLDSKQSILKSKKKKIEQPKKQFKDFLRDCSFFDITQVSKCFQRRLSMVKIWKSKLYINGQLGVGLLGGVSL